MTRPTGEEPRAVPAEAYRRLAVSALVLTVVAGVYLIAALRVSGGTLFNPTWVDYYTRLITSITHGHFWIEPNDPVMYDLVAYHDQAYLYWGLSPLLVIAPFYFLGHGWQSDVAYTFALGVLSVAAFSWMLIQAARALQIPLRLPVLALAALLFAFASPNFYLSVQGRIWHTNQIAATLYCILSLGFTFRFVVTRRLFSVFMAAVFLSLAWDARLTFLATAPILLFGVFEAWRADRATGLKSLTTLAVVSLAAATGWATYNYVRFGRFTETGYTYMQHAERFREAARAGHLWSLKYLPHNWEYYIRHLPFSRKWKHLVFDEEGNSILVMYPWTLLTLALPFFWPRARESRPLMTVLLAVALIQFAAELTFYSTGWTQVGARYFLDSVPVLFVLLLPVIVRTPLVVLGAGVAIGLFLNAAGMCRFYQAPWI